MRQREIEIKKPKTIKRIAVLGDSFTWGIGVSDEERFTELLEKKISATEVLNFGVSGYAAVQYYLIIDDVIKFSPNHVIIAICSNDFADNVYYSRYSYFKPYFVLDENRNISLKGYPIYNTKRFQDNVDGKCDNKYSEVFGSKFLAAIYNLLSIKPKNKKPEQAGLLQFDEYDLYNYSSLNDEKRKYVGEAIYINQQIIKKIKNKLDKNNIKLAVMLVASKCEYDSKCSNNGKNPNHVVNDLVNASMKEIGVDVINTIDVIDPKEDFWINDGHWNPNGHTKAANQIYKYLNSQEFKSR